MVTVTVPDANGSTPGDLSVREDLTTTGSFTIDAPDGLDATEALTIAGTPVSKADLEGSGTTSVAITTPEGVLTITGYNPTTGVVSYSYDPSGMAKDHTGGDVLDTISIVVKDDDGDTDSSTLTINILDTAPVANPDTNAVTEDTAPNPVAGNVITTGAGADTLGTDATAVTGIIAGTGTPTSNVSGGTTSANGTSIAGSFGTLVQGADGSYSYTLDNSNPAVQALAQGQTPITDTFTYTITDTDGDTSSTTLTVSVSGANDAPVITVRTSDGDSDSASLTETNSGLSTSGTLSVFDVDTLDTVAATKVDALTVGGTYTGTTRPTEAQLKAMFSVTGGESSSSAQDAPNGIGWAFDSDSEAFDAIPEGQTLTLTYTVRATDNNGASDDQLVTITITGTNDAPVAVADTRSVTEDAADQSGFNDSNPATTIVAGNVLSNDTDVDTGDTRSVSGVAAGTTPNSGNNVTSGMATTTTGTYGSLSINADGSYTYTLDNTKGIVQALAQGQPNITDTFTYTITDSQGGTSSTTLIVTVNGANDAPVITVRTSDGDSDSASLTETNSGLSTSGTLSVFDVDTLDTVAATKVDALTVGGTYTGTTRPTEAQLKAMFSVTGGESSSSAQDAPNGIGWAFDSNSEAFNAIPVGETLILTYTVRATDNNGAFDDQPVTITITGTNDGVVAVNDTLSIAENAIAAGTPFGGNVLSNDTLDPDFGVTTAVSSFTLDADGNGSQDVFTPGTPVTVTTSSGTLGVLTMASNGAYTFTPHQANYSGPVPVITYTLLSSTGDSDTATLTLTVTPVSDQPGVTRDAATVTTNEDTAVSLGFNAPTVTDALDQNGSGSPGDNPERLSLITLNGVPSGAKLLDGTSGDAVLFTSTGGNITIRLSDVTNLISSPGTATLTMTTAQFEALKFLPVANSGANIARVRMTVTEYEVTDAGSPISGVAGASRNADVAINVLAVTDPVDLKINGSDALPAAPYNATIAEDSALNLTALLTATFQDLDGSERRDIIINNPAGNGTIFVNGNAVAAGGSFTIAWNAAGNTLETSQTGFPAISIAPGANFSGDLNGITVTLSAKDTDGDSTVTTLTQTDSVTLNLHVTPLAGDVSVSGVTTAEDTGVNFLNALTLTDTDGSERITGITVNAVPAGWVIRDGGGTVLFTGNGSNNFSVAASDLTGGVFRNYTITPPAQSSADRTLSISVETTDTQTVNGSTVTSIVNTNLNQTISVTAVAERVGTDSDGDGTPDLTINPSHVYSTAGAEDTWFALNQGSFDLKAGWNNQDTDGSEQTFALLTPVLATESANGSQFRYTVGGVTTTLTYNGTALQIPLSALDTVEFLAPANVSGKFEIQVQALTIDTDPNGGAPVQAISGSATLTNLIIAPVADAVTLAVDAPAVGKEDTAIPLNIRPTSADSTETFNITISQIPAGSVITYGGNPLTISAGSVTITDFSAAVALSITPPLNSNLDFTLNISGVSVDTAEGITSTSAPVSLNMLVDVRGVADTVTVNTQVLQTSEATVDANSQKIALSGAITSVVPFDNDGSETVSLVITGIPANVNVEGLTYIGGTGANRVWSGTPAQINAANLVIKDAHFSGTIKFQVRAVSTENDGNSLTGPTQEVSIQVAPSPEAALVSQTTLAEDTRTQLDFSIQAPNVDSNETVQSVWINAADVNGQPFQLFLGTTPLASAITADAGWYKLSAAQAGNVFAQGAANSDADFSFDIRYEVRDPSSDGTLPATVSQTDATYTLNVTPVTDPTTSANDFVDRIITGTETLTINVTVTQNNDANAGGTKDIDGSEKLLYFTIDNVPAGVAVVGASYIGNTDGSPNTGRWILDIPDTAFNSASLQQPIQFLLNGSSAQLSGLNLPISITAHTQDSGSNVLTSTTNWTLQTDPVFIDTAPAPTDPAANIDTWVPDPVSVTMTEDAPTALSSFVDAQITGSSPFAITITGLPAGSQVSGMTLTTVNGVNVWTAQGSGNDASLQNLLNNISITPPANFNNNQGAFGFTTTLTTYDNGGGRQDASQTFNPPVTPVSDAIDLTTSAASVAEDTPASISLSLSNPEDGTFSQVVNGKVYISLDESAIGAGGTLSISGSPLTVEAVSGMSSLGIPDGNYYVLTGVTSTSNLTLGYQGAAQASGTLSYTAYVQGQETAAANITTSQITGSLSVTPVNDSAVIVTPASVTGAEDQQIVLPLSVTLTDSSEQIASLTLSNIPDGVLVFSGNGSPGSQAINLGGGTWGIPLVTGAVPAYIALQTPANWSGEITGLELGVWSGEPGLDPTLTSSSFDVTVNGVADGINMTPTLSFGASGAVVPLNLNSTMPDSDGSEVATLSIKYLGAHASFYAGSTLLTASYDLASDTYTLDNLSSAQVSALGVTQKSGNYALQIEGYTTDSPGSSQSAVTSVNLQLNLSSAGNGSNLLDDGSSILMGTDRNDSLTGGPGSDTLTGGAGADLFIWNNGDKSFTPGSPDQDVITDFKPSEGDRIDLRSLLIDEQLPGADINDYLRVSGADSSILEVSSTGQFGSSGNPDVTIQLQGVNLNAYGASSSDIINSLIAGADPLVKVDHT